MSNVKVLAFTGERFYQGERALHAKQTSVLFLQKTFGRENVLVAASIDYGSPPPGCSTSVDLENFYEMPIELW